MFYMEVMIKSVIMMFCCITSLQVVCLQQHYVRPTTDDISETVLSEECKIQTGLSEDAIRSAQPLEQVLEEVRIHSLPHCAPKGSPVYPLELSPWEFFIGNYFLLLLSKPLGDTTSIAGSPCLTMTNKSSITTPAGTSTENGGPYLMAPNRTMDCPHFELSLILSLVYILRDCWPL